MNALILHRDGESQAPGSSIPRRAKLWFPAQGGMQGSSKALTARAPMQNCSTL